MKYVKLSETQIINLDRITRLEILASGDVQYVIVHFQDGESYRCTEEESDLLLEIMARHVERNG